MFVQILKKNDELIYKTYSTYTYSRYIEENPHELNN